MDSNRLLIDFFNPKSSPDYIKIVATIQIRTQIPIPNSISIDLYQKLANFILFIVIFNINRLLNDFNDLFIYLFDLYINLLIEMDPFFIEIAIVDSISLLDCESDQNWQKNLDTGFDSTTTIRFTTPNRISLVLCLRPTEQTSFLQNVIVQVLKVYFLSQITTKSELGCHFDVLFTSFRCLIRVI